MNTNILNHIVIDNLNIVPDIDIVRNLIYIIVETPIIDIGIDIRYDRYNGLYRIEFDQYSQDGYSYGRQQIIQVDTHLNINDILFGVEMPYYSELVLEDIRVYVNHYIINSIIFNYKLKNVPTCSSHRICVNFKKSLINPKYIKYEKYDKIECSGKIDDHDKVIDGMLCIHGNCTFIYDP